MVSAAILAGGTGSRMGAALPKQFLEIGGKPILLYSVEAFLSQEEVDLVVIASNPEYVEYTEELLSRFVRSDKPVFVIPGGSFRGETLKNVLNFLRGRGELEGVILTHDAVRPFIDGRIIADNIRAAEEYGACNTCVPAVDTVFISEDGRFISSVPERKTVFHAQTPQSFDAQKLWELIGRTPADEFEKMTDGCSVFSYHGEKTAIVRGDINNIKITFPGDIQRAEMILKGRE